VVSLGKKGTMEQYGDILEIDLLNDHFRRRAYTEAEARFILAGRGFNAQTLLREVGPDLEALSPESPLMISAGLMTNTAAPSSSRLHLGARSPLTGLLGSSSVGGRTGPALRSNGFFGLILRNVSPHPVYVYMENGRAELRDASELWGLDTTEAAAQLKMRHGEEGLGLLMIGPAGENGVELACVVTGRGHAAGRTGMGALMGAKRVKAIVMRRVRTPARNSPEIKAAVKRFSDKLVASPSYEEWVRYGSSASVEWSDQMGMLATRNYQTSTFEGASDIDGRSMERYVQRHRACHRCPIHCKAEMKIEAGRYAGFEGERPEYEPIVAWGSKCGLGDAEAVMFLHNLCDRLGLDSVSAGSTVAFAMELYEKGIISRDDTGGLELTWGNVDAMEQLIREMASGEGFGGLLGHGIERTVEQLGPQTKPYAPVVKGLELTAMDPRAAYGSGLGYAVSTRGGDYTSIYSRHEWSISPEKAKELYGDERAADRLQPHGKAELVRRAMIVSAVVDCLGICKVPSLSLINEYDLENEAELVQAITGLDLSAGELYTIGERVITMERIFNSRFAWLYDMDQVPEMFTRRPLPDGPAAGRAFELDGMLAEFYEVMGWQAMGLPTERKLRELGLDEFVDEVVGRSAVTR